MVGTGKSLSSVLRGFVSEHPEGWDHGSWQRLLNQLEERGISTADPAAIGRQLEQERLSLTLEDLGVKGLGPKRREVVVTTYGRLWELRQAPVDELAKLPAFNPKLAEQLAEALR